MIKFLLDILNWFDTRSVCAWVINKIVYNNQTTIDMAAFSRRYPVSCTPICKEYIDAATNKQRKGMGVSYALSRTIFEDKLIASQISKLHDSLYLCYRDISMYRILANDLIANSDASILDYDSIHFEEEYIKEALYKPKRLYT